jgi:hypothetical protein
MQHLLNQLRTDGWAQEPALIHATLLRRIFPDSLNALARIDSQQSLRVAFDVSQQVDQEIFLLRLVS